MDYFDYHGQSLFAEEVPLADIAQQYGTPCYVYSRATLERHWHAFADALGEHPHMICYAVKACSNLAILNLFAKLGSGFDVVSIGELERVIAAEGDPSKVVFSGVGKTATEMQRALKVGIYCFNVESYAELCLLNEVAGKLGMKAPTSLRINPDVDAKSHPYISTGLRENKFGIPVERAIELYRQHQDFPHINFVGIDCHIGSQLTELEPFMEALDHLLALCKELKTIGLDIKHLDLGGGLGVRYKDETPPLPHEQAQQVKQKLQGHGELTILLEPGRAIAANAGVLLTQVEYTKHNEKKSFAIVDAAMNDLIRPSLYNAWQDIVPVEQRSQGKKEVYDIVGPICETGDFLGKDRELILEAGDLLAIRSAGAYGFSMSSNYNSRPRAAEVMVDQDKSFLIRSRETLAELYANEQLIK